MKRKKAGNLILKIYEALKKSILILKKAGIESAMLDSQLLLSKAIKKDKLYVMVNRNEQIDDSKLKEFVKMVQIRSKYMPVKYILGHSEFMGIDFNIRQGVLIPRPDTEILAEDALKEIDKNSYKIICDVCTGSGAIGMSIASLNKNVTCDCLDISEDALDIARENLIKLGISEKVKVIKSDLLEVPISNCKKYDVVISNPPYIEKSEIGKLDDSVKKYEPYIALCGGDDGLDFYRNITMQSLKVLNNNGMLIYEIGYNQKDDVINIMKNAGFSEISFLKDLSGNDRVVKGKYTFYN